MRSWMILIVVGAGLFYVGGCRQVGTTCQNSGSTQECGDGFICTFARNPGDPNDADNTLPPLEVCLRRALPDCLLLQPEELPDRIAT
jgi:hypothetical protein